MLFNGRPNKIFVSIQKATAQHDIKMLLKRIKWKKLFKPGIIRKITIFRR